MPRPKVGIVGAGNVGAAAAFLLTKRNMCDVILSDIVAGLPQGKSLDMNQCRMADHHDATVTGTNRIEDMEDCAVVVITAGVPRKPGMSREQLLEINTNILRDVCEKLKNTHAHPVLIVVTNPLDVMTYAALKITGYPKRRVLGMAGVLDSNRFAHFVAERLRVSPREVQAMVLGSHGDTMVALPRFTTVAGIPIPELLSKEECDALAARTRDGGAEIVALLKTGSAYYAPGSSIAAMVGSILFDQDRVMPCSVLLEGEYGLKDVVVGVPCKLGDGGLKQIIELKLTPDESAALQRSAAVVRENIKLLKL
ncbi:MAG: malate dehydrogenase [Planctomycetes bacterium]|nr:malate dehydrogenase [Planctomycetota bacterium]